MNPTIRRTRNGRYRFRLDVTPIDQETGRRIPGPRRQECFTFDTLDEARTELNRVTRQVELGVYSRHPVIPLRRRAELVGKVPAIDLFTSGLCTPNCMFGHNERYERYVGCACPCEGKYHGILIDVAVPAKPQTVEAGAS